MAEEVATSNAGNGLRLFGASGIKNNCERAWLSGKDNRAAIDRIVSHVMASSRQRRVVEKRSGFRKNRYPIAAVAVLKGGCIYGVCGKGLRQRSVA